MNVWSGEKIAFTLATLVFVGSTIIFGRGAAREKADEKPIPPHTSEQLKAVASDETARFGLAGIPWLPPSAGARDVAWTYELFGPPVIHYDTSLRQLKVASSDKDAGEADGITPGGPKRVIIQHVPFHLQLVGHFGEGPDATGTFANLKTGETFLARAGQEVPGLGLTISKFNVTRQPVAIPDSMTAVESVATAEVLDQSNGEVTVLTDREWAYVEPAPIQSAVKFDPVLQP